MPHVQSAYYLIADELPKYCREWMNFPSSPYWIHESAVANFLGIPTGTGEHGQSQALTSIVACIKTGFGGSRNRKNKQATGVQVADLKTQTNGTRVCYHFAAMAKRLPPLPLLWKHQSIFLFLFDHPSIHPSNPMICPHSSIDPSNNLPIQRYPTIHP